MATKKTAKKVKKDGAETQTKRPKNQELPGLESKKIPELTAAAEKYADIRDKRMAMTDKEVEAKMKVMALMKEHKLEAYRDDDLLVTFENKENIKVKITKDSDENGDD